MSTGSSPSAFAEFANARLTLPESLRENLKWPLGPIVHGPDVLGTIGAASPVVSVGDFCTLDLIARGRTPDISLVDFKTKRQEDPELREAFERIPAKVMRLNNPAATIVALPGRKKEEWKRRRSARVIPRTDRSEPSKTRPYG